MCTRVHACVCACISENVHVCAQVHLFERARVSSKNNINNIRFEYREQGELSRHVYMSTSYKMKL